MARAAMMDIKDKIGEIGLTPDNAVIIGSGILNALHLRESRDIDVVVTEDKYKELSADDRFKKTASHGKELLVGDLFEIGTSWTVVGETWKFDDLLEHSTVVNDVRYNSIEFLLAAKKGWLANGEARQKDAGDVELMESYLKRIQ